MGKLQIILVDDEKRVRNSLRKVLQLNYPEADIIAEADNIADAESFIRTLKPDVVLLDIKMPGGTGFELLNKLFPLQFKVIFITAFNEFAIKAFKYSAIDYLMKPVIANELIESLNKAKQKINTEEENIKLKTLIENLGFKNKKIVLNTHEATHIVSLNEIIRCEAERNYTYFYLLDKKPILMSGGLKEYDGLLSPDGFIRCHHSHLVNLSFVSKLDKKQGGVLILKDGSHVPVSSRKYAELSEAINSFNS
ncbi:MAG: response regulator transcription factor [Bacteroidetes bacterium]|nr:response regulator transcription factor [Bacteroidota bacterium]